MRATDCLTWLVRRPAAALLAVLVLGTVSFAHTETNKVMVEDVICQGNHLVPTQEIISQIKTRPSTEYREEVVQEDLRRLLATNKFTKESRVEKVTVGSNSFARRGDLVYVVPENLGPRSVEVAQLVPYKKMPLRQFQP